MTLEAVRERLPEPVAERVHVLSGGEETARGGHVLYWMHHAVRGHENPALDAALLAAVELELPLLVFQGPDTAERFASDRHLTFALEGARDARAELSERGLTHVLWLGEDAERPSPLVALADEAVLVVTDEHPVAPYPERLGRLAARSAAAIWTVDTACVVPMRLPERQFDRAFRFRDAIRRPLAERLERPWVEVDAAPAAFDRRRLPFDDVDLEGAEIAELVARCPVDHTVGPVAHTPGGSVAGYRRWRAFRDGGLRSYAARRNDAAGDGVSRLSAYLNLGHVSPLRIAREAAAAGGKGAEKYLDELIVWRELAYNLCLHRHREIDTLAVLPGWARRSLAEHAGDSRDALSWERLARGRTGDRLWDLCQASLVRHGELHNNVRMTWGKAIPAWSGGPERALELLLDLNHRFALDGSHPSSYGGLLWCLGLFDRPFRPERPVLGSVRSRPTAAHAERLDLERYAERVLAPATGRPLEVAVVGAGLSGLTCARALAVHGHRVRVFDKGRGVGGRMSTRRDGERRFDHGAQYFTARDPRFARRVDSWRRDGLVDRWEGKIAVLGGGKGRGGGSTERFVGVPGMSAVCRHLAADLDVALDTRIGGLERGGDRWRLSSPEDGDLGRFDAVVLSAPAPQTAELLAGVAPEMAERAAGVEMSPCWAVMASFAAPLDTAFDAAFVHGSPLGWIARNASKPSRPREEAWVLHATPEWSRRRLELDRESAAQELLEAFREVAGVSLGAPLGLDAHLWRFALPEALAESCLFDAGLRVAACGDWCGGPRVEGAFLSGSAAAGRLLA